ncbi:MAG TPA: hypothetical protein VFT61_08570 [Sphingomicrobium sp.]|nr:hypothetical protein [Sphingomicrobium sp.]
MQNEHSVQVAAERRKPGRPRIYPFDEIKPGEFVRIEGKSRDQIAASVAAAERRTGFMFLIRNTLGGVIVGRVSAEREEDHRKIRAARKARRDQRRKLTGLGTAHPTVSSN